MIGTQIKKYRKLAGLTQSAFADRVDDIVADHTITNVVISRYERGEQMPAYETIVGMAVVLGISIEAFYTDEPISDNEEIMKILDPLGPDELQKVLHHLYFHYYFTSE